MKFRHKILLISIIFFIIALDISVISIINRSWNLNFELEKDRAYNEHTLIANSIIENLNAISSRGISIEKEIFYDVLNSYENYYSERGATLQLWDNEKNIFPDKIFLSTQSVKNNFIQISNKLSSPYEQLTFVYSRNIDSLYNTRKNINEFFILVNFIAGSGFIIVMFFAIKNITKPLYILSEMTQQIAEGDYSKRININKDEFGELGNNFNKMSLAVEEHIINLSDMATKKQMLVDNMAHELRTPLTSINGFADFLINANSSDEDKTIAIQYIKSETQRLNRLSSKLLDISNLRYEKIELIILNTKKLFETVKDLESNNLNNNKQKLIIKNNFEYIKGDFDLLVSFLTNCIENSIHASEKNSKIILSSYKHKEKVVIEVQDFGCGMSDEQVKNAFENFYRTDKSRSRQHGGAGLGLSLCKQIADVLDAEIIITSNIKKGTSIKLFLQLDNNFEKTP